MTEKKVVLEGGSPLLVVDGRPVAWYENWLKNCPEGWHSARALREGYDREHGWKA